MSGGEWIAVIVLAWYAFWSLTAFGVYGVDKLAALRGWRRVRERRLHELAVLGGWPGGWLAQQVFRHKRRKAAFMRWFWVIAIVHVVVWLGVGVLVLRWSAGGEGVTAG